MKRIFLTVLGVSVVLLADFSKTGNIVTDSTTGLQWQDIQENKVTAKSWKESISYCEDLTLDRYTDWRLPNLNELHTLVDDSAVHPAISGAFEYTASRTYWSSTSMRSATGGSTSAWGVRFDDGYDDLNSKPNYSSYVRCVRAGE